MMGWNAWPSFAINGADSDDLIRRTADGMVANGLLAAGYQYVGLDDKWASGRDANGNLVADPVKYPFGIPALVAYVHGKGLKFGIYAEGGSPGCGGGLGSYGHERQDAALFVSWGVDLVKWDVSCSMVISPQDSARLMATVLNPAGVVLTTGTGDYDSAYWFAGVGAQSARIGPDMIFGAGINTWDHMSSAFTSESLISQYGGPNHWLDLDCMMVGEGGLTDTEARTNMSLWAIQAAPLLLGLDVRTGAPSVATLAILTNSDVIAVDQDRLGITGVKVSSAACGSSTCEVWAKPLDGGACALALFNRDTASHDITANFSSLAAAFPACGSGPYTTTRDLWTHAGLGTLATSYTATAVPGHGVAMIRVAP